MIRPQYHFRQVSGTLCAWNVARLIRLSRDLPVTNVPLSEIGELDEHHWGIATDIPTARWVAEHANLMRACDPEVPIIMCADRRVMDGMHRVARRFIDGKTDVPARIFLHTPQPDFCPADPDKLTYAPEDFRI